MQGPESEHPLSFLRYRFFSTLPGLMEDLVSGIERRFSQRLRGNYHAVLPQAE